MIPKLLHHIWVGPLDPPTQWMDTWPALHPAWTYKVWGNAELAARRWRNQHIITAYWHTNEWRGVADCMRYEILHEVGGFMPGADSVCERPVDALLLDPEVTAYAVYENEQAAPGLITPVYAASPGAAFLDAMIQQVSLAEPGEPWAHVGNKLMQRVYESRAWPDVKIWPSWMFNPEHYTGVTYTGSEQPYARQQWGSTKQAYA